MDAVQPLLRKLPKDRVLKPLPALPSGPAYYNEIDPKAAATLRELIKNGVIAAGDVDERSIEDVAPTELAGYTQRHFFAGFGVWSYALRLAGWPDDRMVVTGSCPCQPFSSAGRGGGFSDERHLWPALYWHLLFGRTCTAFGEQVASRDGLAWIDTVSSDLEASAHTVAAVDLCAAGVGSPNIRQRLFWMADPQRNSPKRHGFTVGGAQGRDQSEGDQRKRIRVELEHGVDAGILAYTSSKPGAGRLCDHRTAGQRGTISADSRGNVLLGDAEREGFQRQQPEDLRGTRRWQEGRATPESGIPFSGMAYADGGDAGAEREQRSRQHGLVSKDGGVGGGAGIRPGPTNGFWRNADWLLCRDGVWRPVEPGTSPLAHGNPGRVGRLRGYGNAINAELAAAFVREAMQLI